MSAHIGVWPEDSLARLRRLLGALEQALPVQFVAHAGGRSQQLDALIAFGSSPEPARVPTLLMPDLSRSCAPDRPESWRFATAEPLDARLRGRTLDERRSAARPLTPEPGDAVMAIADERPVWVRRAAGEGPALEETGVPCEELGEREVLRDQLVPGRFAALLPLLHFLREAAGRHAWEPPPLRANLLLDDPNLHSTRYGYLRFARLAEHARRHGYHASIATIPIDLGYVSPRARRWFLERPGELSLVMHGVAHDGTELMRERSFEQWSALLAQALRRIARFERRGGPRVARIMVPPHGVCSETSMRAMLMLGVEAVCTFWAFPQPPGTVPPGWPLAGFELAQWGAGGLPVLQRWPLVDHPLEELVFRAFLDQPLIVFGHHEDLAHGLDRIEEVVDLINGLGSVDWMPLERIAHTNALSRTEPGELHTRQFTQRSLLSVGDAVRRLAVEFPPVAGPATEHTLRIGAFRMPVELSDRAAAASVEVEPRSEVELELTPIERVDPTGVPPPPPQLRAWLRRAAAESRDRLRPLTRR